LLHCWYELLKGLFFENTVKAYAAESIPICDITSQASPTAYDVNRLATGREKIFSLEKKDSNLNSSSRKRKCILPPWSTSKHNMGVEADIQGEERDRGPGVQGVHGVPSDQGLQSEKLAGKVRKVEETVKEEGKAPSSLDEIVNASRAELENLSAPLVSKPPLVSMSRDIDEDSGSFASEDSESGWSSASSVAAAPFKAIGRYARKGYDKISWHRKFASYELLFPHGEKTEGLEDMYDDLCKRARFVAVIVKAEQ